MCSLWKFTELCHDLYTFLYISYISIKIYSVKMPHMQLVSIFKFGYQTEICKWRIHIYSSLSVLGIQEWLNRQVDSHWSVINHSKSTIPFFHVTSATGYILYTVSNWKILESLSWEIDIICICVWQRERSQDKYTNNY